MQEEQNTCSYQWGYVSSLEHTDDSQFSLHFSLGSRREKNLHSMSISIKIIIFTAVVLSANKTKGLLLALLLRSTVLPH